MSTGSRAEAVLDALGDPNRRRILDVLAGGPASVQAIADQMPISRPAVSRHLRLLRAAELVADEAHGTRNIYRLRAEGVDAARDYFDQVWNEAAGRFRLVVENVEGDAGPCPGRAVSAVAVEWPSRTGRPALRLVGKCMTIGAVIVIIFVGGRLETDPVVVTSTYYEAILKQNYSRAYALANAELRGDLDEKAWSRDAVRISGFSQEMLSRLQEESSEVEPLLLGHEQGVGLPQVPDYVEIDLRLYERFPGPRDPKVCISFVKAGLSVRIEAVQAATPMGACPQQGR